MTKQDNLNAHISKLLEQGRYDEVARLAVQAGNGAIAQGENATAVGVGGAYIGGDNSGTLNLRTIIQIGIRPGASKADLRRAYLARLLTESNQLPLFVGDSTTAQIKLSSVYTALLTRRSKEMDETKIRHARANHRSLIESPEFQSALEVLNQERKLVLLGGPGSGKSTFINFVALCMAGELLGLTSPNLQTLTTPLPKYDYEPEKPKPQKWAHGPKLPVHIVLRDMAAQLPAPGQKVNAETVWDYICGRLKQTALEDFGLHLHEELLQQGGLILLDGLDEVPDALTRREQVKEAVQDFAKTFGRCHFLVTSRTYAYQRQDWKLNGFTEVGLQPFTPQQINAFVDAWYAHMVELSRLTESDAQGRATILKRTVGNNERIRELAERPLLLTLISQLQTDGGGVLPEKREELYDKAVEMLLNKWEGLKIHRRDDGSPEIELSLAEWLNASRNDIRKELNRLAFGVHLNQTELVGTADIRQAELIAALLNASANQADVKVKRLEEYLRDRAGILAEHGVGLYQFPHRSFQEYLAASHLTDEDFPDKIAELASKDLNRWREVALLAGAKAARGSTSNVWNLVEALCFAPVPSDHAMPADSWGALLAGQMLVENADLARIAPRNMSKLDRVRNWQVHLLTGDLPPVERALAGRSLAVLGDPRKGVGV